MRFALAAVLIAGLAGAQNAPLEIVVTRGQNDIVNIRLRPVYYPEVQVLDRGNPVAGVPVRFSLPASGAGGVFGNGTDTVTVTTDANGHAAANGIQYRGVGKYEIRVIANYDGQTATAFIEQTNVEGISSSGGGRSKRIWIVLGVGAAIAAGVAIGTTLSGPGHSNGPIVITPGTPSVGGPR